MSQTQMQRVEMTQLRRFDRRVARRVCALVNEMGLRYRLDGDGNHLYLYPPDHEEGNEFSYRPFKVGTHRPAEVQIRYLEQWVTDYVEPYLADAASQAPADTDAPVPAGDLEAREIESSQATAAFQEAAEVEALRRAMRSGRVRITLGVTLNLSQGGAMTGVTVEREDGRRWRKVCPMLFPNTDKGETVSDVVAMLMRMRDQ